MQNTAPPPLDSFNLFDYFPDLAHTADRTTTLVTLPYFLIVFIVNTSYFLMIFIVDEKLFLP